jgi:hypothetical protein
MSITSAEEVAAEDAVQRQFAATAYAEVLHVAQLLQPDADVLNVRCVGQVWVRLRRAWVAAGEPDTFTQFADTALEQLATAAVARMA